MMVVYAAICGFLCYAGVSAFRPRQPDQRTLSSVLSHRDTAVIFDGQSYGGYWKNMTISRQGATIYRGPVKRINFSLNDLHKEFLVDLQPVEEVVPGTQSKLPCTQVLFLKAEKRPGLCSTGLFTTPELTCTPISSRKLEDDFAQLVPLLPCNDRGFGLEFEFVGRQISMGRVNEYTKYAPIPVVQDLMGQAIVRLSETRRGQLATMKNCFQDVTTNTQKNVACKSTTDCALSEYCLDCDKCKKLGAECGSCFAEPYIQWPWADASTDTMPTGHAVCHPRVHCQPESAMEGACPPAGAVWNWELDGSVAPLSQVEAELLGADENETHGLNFEVTSPGPDHVLSGRNGLRAAHEMLAVLRHIGIQAGPSQGMHVHINVLNPNVPGKPLSYEAIAKVWVAYAKYQLVIDEMFSPGRPMNRFANRLHLSNCEPLTSGRCVNDPCGCVHAFFKNMHTWVTTRQQGSSLDFCNSALHVGEDRKGPCLKRWPHQRYFQLNLVPLHKYGTIEFRSHSATYDEQRVARWVQFLIGFVEYFGHGPGNSQMQEFFESTARLDYEKLQRAQRKATSEELFDKLINHNLIDMSSKEYFMKREWEIGDAACLPTPGVPQVLHASCSSLQDDGTDFVQAVIKSESGAAQTLQVKLPSDTSWRENLQVMLPDGKRWTIKIENGGILGSVVAVLPYGEKVPIKGNVFKIEYDPEAIAYKQLQFEIEQHNRCCCTDTSCLWYPNEKVLANGHCPRLISDNRGRECTTSSRCLLTWINGSCRQSKQAEKEGDCKVTKNPDAYFVGDVCKPSQSWWGST